MIPETTPGLADRPRGVKVSASSAMTDKARKLKAAGHPIISLSSGEPDVAAPDHVVEAAVAAARGGDTKYPPQNGMPALKDAVQRKFERDNRLRYELDETCSPISRAAWLGEHGRAGPWTRIPSGKAAAASATCAGR